MRSPVNNTRGQVRCLLISRRRCGQDDKIRDDPDVRNILGSIKKDFEQKQDGNKERAPEEAKGSAPAEGKARDLGALLEEIYGGEGGGGGQGSVGGYLEYRDEDATVILDVEEEREAARRAMEEGREVAVDKRRKPRVGAKYSALSQGRGARGVFEVGELVEVVRGEKCRDLVVVRVPQERNYADYLVIATGRNSRHIRLPLTSSPPHLLTTPCISSPLTPSPALPLANPPAWFPRSCCPCSRARCLAQTRFPAGESG